MRDTAKLTAPAASVNPASQLGSSVFPSRTRAGTVITSRIGSTYEKTNRKTSPVGEPL